LIEVNVSTNPISEVQDFDWAIISDYLIDMSPTVDGSGDIAVAFSASSASLYPSLGFTGRGVNDPIDTMGSFRWVKMGSGNDLQGRYGDYMAAVVDPSNTGIVYIGGEYFTSGASTWSTWIGGSSLQAFNVYAVPNAISFPSGGSGGATIYVSSINGYSGTVSLSASFPPGISSCSLNPTSVTINSANPKVGSTLICPSSLGGIYTVTVTGLGPTGSVSNTLVFYVYDFSLSFSSSSSVTTISATVSESSQTPYVSIPIYITTNNAWPDGQLVYFTTSTSPNPGSGMTFSFNPNPCYINHSQTVTEAFQITVNTLVPTGVYQVDVTGQNGSLQHDILVNLQVTT